MSSGVNRGGQSWSSWARRGDTETSMMWESIWKAGTGPGPLPLLLFILETDWYLHIRNTQRGQQAEPDDLILALCRSGGDEGTLHRWDMLPQTQPTGQFVGLGVPCAMHARHAGICDSCGQGVETFGQSWQLERRDRWSRAHPIESACVRG